MRISDWSSDVCSSDLHRIAGQADFRLEIAGTPFGTGFKVAQDTMIVRPLRDPECETGDRYPEKPHADRRQPPVAKRSEEHTSELQSLMRISCAVFCLKKKKKKQKEEEKHNMNTTQRSITIRH